MHTGTPGMCLGQATTLQQVDVLVHQGADPIPLKGLLTAKRMHGQMKQKVIVLCQQWKNFLTAN